MEGWKDGGVNLPPALLFIVSTSRVYNIKNKLTAQIHIQRVWAEPRRPARSTSPCCHSSSRQTREEDEEEESAARSSRNLEP